MLPRHVGIIPDGNRRWAKRRGLPPWKGHEEGVKRFEEIMDAAFDMGIEFLTFYGFSLKNFQRSDVEKRAIFNIMRMNLPKLERKAHEKGVRVIFPGRKELFPPDIGEKLKKIEEKTAERERTLLILFGYDGEDEIKRAAAKFARAFKEGKAGITDFERFLDIPPTIPKMDLVIRTSGEQRISGFPLMHISYAELYFSPKFWPDFTVEDFERAIEEYKKRERRFGK